MNPSILNIDRCVGRSSGWSEFLLHLSLHTPGEIALSGSEKAEVIAGNVDIHFQAVNDTSVPAFIETVDVALRS